MDCPDLLAAFEASQKRRKIKKTAAVKGKALQSASTAAPRRSRGRPPSDRGRRQNNVQPSSNTRVSPELSDEDSDDDEDLPVSTEPVDKSGTRSRTDPKKLMEELA